MDGVAIASVITSGVLGAAGIWFGAWNAERERRARKSEREAQDHADYVRRGAETLAPITTLLTSLEPDRITVNASVQYLEKIAALRKRWEEQIRDLLAAFALSHPSGGVQQMAVELDTHVDWVLTRGVSLVRDVLSDRDHEQMRELVWDHYRWAQALIADLHAGIAQEEGTAMAPAAAAQAR
jgi:hypothetical protein